MNFIYTLFLLLSSHSIFATECGNTATSFKCVKFVKNYDADTITVNIKETHPLLGKNAKVRVNGIDTPEIRTKNLCEKNKGRLAKKFVNSLLRKAKRIDLLNVKRGKYFRIVADVMVDGKSLTELLLKNKLGVIYHGKTKQKINWCK